MSAKNNSFLKVKHLLILLVELSQNSITSIKNNLLIPSEIILFNTKGYYKP